MEVQTSPRSSPPLAAKSQSRSTPAPPASCSTLSPRRRRQHAGPHQVRRRPATSFRHRLGPRRSRDAHVGKIYRFLGFVSPDDCNLALRGLATLGIRLKHLEQSTLHRLAQAASRNRARPPPRPARLPRPRNMEARLHRLRQRLLDRLQRHLAARANRKIRRSPPSLQNRLQLGRRHQPRDGLRIARPRQPQLRPPPGPPQHRVGRTQDLIADSTRLRALTRIRQEGGHKADDNCQWIRQSLRISTR